MDLPTPASDVGNTQSVSDSVADSGDDALKCYYCDEAKDDHIVVKWGKFLPILLVCPGQYEDIDQYQSKADAVSLYCIAPTASDRYDHCASCGLLWGPEGRYIPSRKCPACGSKDLIECE
jgi:hypothetical protein